MPQPNLFSDNAEEVPLASARPTVVRQAPAPSPAAPPPERLRGKLGRGLGVALLATEFLLAVMVRIFIGVIVLVLPWSPLWDSNHLLLNYPRLAHFMAYGATRGILSGIGLLNLWVAVDDTLHRSQRHL